MNNFIIFIVVIPIVLLFILFLSSLIRSVLKERTTKYSGFSIAFFLTLLTLSLTIIVDLLLV